MRQIASNIVIWDGNEGSVDVLTHDDDKSAATTDLDFLMAAIVKNAPDASGAFLIGVSYLHLALERQWFVAFIALDVLHVPLLY